MLQNGQVSPINRGFCFDDGGNTPLGKQGYVELIQTPADLAQFQTEKYYHEDLILSNVLRGSNFLIGSRELYEDYVHSIEIILKKEMVEGARTINVSMKRALDLLSGHLNEFSPHVKDKENSSLFNIKTELYRPLSFFIACLAEYYSINDLNTWDKIDVLVSKKIISDAGGANLKNALDLILHLRIRCQLHYGKECDLVAHPAISRNKNEIPFFLKEVFLLEDEDVEKILLIFRTILPLHLAFKGCCQSQDFSPLSGQTFYDDSLITQGKAFEKLFKYEQAKELYEKAIALDANDLDALVNLIEVHLVLEDFHTAEKYAKELFDISKELNSNELAIVSLKLLSQACHLDTNKSFQYLEKALEIQRKLNGESSIDFSRILYRMGLAKAKSQEKLQALNLFETALEIGKTAGADPYYLVTMITQIGTCHLDLDHSIEAIENFEKAHKISEEIKDMNAICSCLELKGVAIAILITTSRV